MFRFFSPAAAWLWMLFFKSPRAVAWLGLVVCTWCYRSAYTPILEYIIDSSVSLAEEFCKSALREVVKFWYRVVNSASVWIGALFLGGGWHRTGTAAWMDTGKANQNSAWAQQQSTLNAVVARNVATRTQGEHCCVRSVDEKQGHAHCTCQAAKRTAKRSHAAR